MGETVGSRNWVVAQIGSREHYALARVMARRGQLARLYTDLWMNRSQSLLRTGAAAAGQRGAALRSMAGRYHPELAEAPVTSFNLGGLVRMTRDRLSAAGPDVYRRYLETGRWFSSNVRRSLKAQSLDPTRTAAFLFSTGALEAMSLLQEQGIPVLIDQPDPARVELALCQAEAERWPGWDLNGLTRVPNEYFDRLAAEWSAADGVVVNSNWSRDALVQQGVSAEKIHVIPLAYEPETPAVAKAPPTRGQPLRVLWLGQLVLRKGLPYLFEAARMLLNEPVAFEVVGPICVTEQALAAAPANVRIAGPVPRADVADLYRRADVFVLPTISDGFAITQLEAMAAGLPVITTPRCGEVVIDGVNGLIVPPADAEQLAAAIRSLAVDRDRLAALSTAAIERVKAFSLDRFGDAVDQAGERIAKKNRADGGKRR